VPWEAFPRFVSGRIELVESGGANLCFHRGISATASPVSVSDKGPLAPLVVSAELHREGFGRCDVEHPANCVEGIDRRALQAGVLKLRNEVRWRSASNPLLLREPFLGSKKFKVFAIAFATPPRRKCVDSASLQP